ncbi:MAG: hypothetical protein WBL19_03145 [Minisyncoccia bacterium]
MLSQEIQNLIKIPLVLVVFWMLLSGLSQMSMDMSMLDGKVNCPFGSHSMAICQTNPMEHIQEWQSMFTMLPAQNILLTLFVLFAFLFIRKLHSRFSIPQPPLSYPDNRAAYSQSFQIFDPLKEAFSSGILNPKIF